MIYEVIFMTKSCDLTFNFLHVSWHNHSIKNYLQILHNIQFWKIFFLLMKNNCDNQCHTDDIHTVTVTMEKL